MPFFIVIGFFVIIAVVIIARYNYLLKKRILDSGPLNDESLKILKALSNFGSEALKWGIILLSGGIGLVLLEFIPFSAESSPLPYGVEIICIAGGFLIYYTLSKKEH